jgi:molecular chaperone GrpE
LWQKYSIRINSAMADQQQLTEDATQLSARVQSIYEVLASLEKQVGRAGREQFKANALNETQAEQLTQVLAQLQQAEAQRKAAEIALREAQTAEMAHARLEVVQKVIPALDGIDAAMHSGQHMLDQQARQYLLHQLLHLPHEPSAQEIASLRAMLQAWLHGLGFVQRRLLDMLASEGVVPILSVGQHFDPHQHLVMEVVHHTTLAPGMIAQELRRGYRHAGQIIRHAEVVVVGTHTQKETSV